MKAPFPLLSLNKFNQTFASNCNCQTNILTNLSALLDALSASLFADLTIYVTLISEKNSISFFQHFELQGRDLFKAFSGTLIDILH